MLRSKERDSKVHHAWLLEIVQSNLSGIVADLKNLGVRCHSSELFEFAWLRSVMQAIHVFSNISKERHSCVYPALFVRVSKFVCKFVCLEISL